MTSHYEEPIHEHEICFVDGELVISEELLARIEQAPPIRCACGLEPTPDDRDLWRVWVLREEVTHQMHGSGHLPVVSLPVGVPSYVCGTCTELMTTGQLRPLARRLLKPLPSPLPLARLRPGAYDQTVTELVLWLMKIREKSDVFTGDEWLARTLGEQR
ncbi:hypothetical protein Cme02nite_45090 [Catellatospora methionotrophica]|uniref:Uncharacterized protein n=1 Tax=Catellatospora methionotrophica TaxID=121620 RepID=A0A8J3LBQ5_9ACTN|nr:hypothetical protein [Catellatospora methionotrophica]GIG16177.1 hypothetical protein Cme02nite_45090 [Catellatospora methionotrophica]